MNYLILIFEYYNNLFYLLILNLFKNVRTVRALDTKKPLSVLIGRFYREQPVGHLSIDEAPVDVNIIRVTSSKLYKCLFLFRIGNENN